MMAIQPAILVDRNGGLGLRRNCIGLIFSLMLISLILVLISLISISPGFAQDSLTSFGDEMAGVAADNATEDDTVISETAVGTEMPPLQGIWKISLAGSEITMAVNQSGDSLFGLAKFEGTEPWNGVIAGSLSGRAVYIALAALQGNVLVSTHMNGTVLDDSMEGNYVRSSSDGNAAKGEFIAARISPDTAGYSPAQVETAPPAASAEQAEGQTEVQVEEQAEQAQPDAQSAVQAKSRSFKDVRDLARGIDPNIMPRHAPL